MFIYNNFEKKLKNFNLLCKNTEPTWLVGHSQNWPHELGGHFHHMQRGLNIQCSAAWALGGHILGPPTKMPFKWDFLLMTLMECGPGFIYLIKNI